MFGKCSLKLIVAASLLTLIYAPPAHVTRAAFQQQEKETLFREFNDKKRADPKDAYRVSKSYIEKFGKDTDDNTKYVKEWVVAYEAVMSRTGTTDSNAANAGTSKPATAPTSANTSDISGTTWQMKGKEDGKTWAEIFVFKPGGRFQYEKYGTDGSSNVRAGTWRQLDESLFATLLGPDGNSTGTVRAELKGACLQATLIFQGQPEWRFLMETDSAPNACKDEREAERQRESDPKYAQKLLTDLVNSVGKIPQNCLTDDFSSCSALYKINFPSPGECGMFDADRSESTFKLTGSTVVVTTHAMDLSQIDTSTIKVLFDERWTPGHCVSFETKNGQKTISESEQNNFSGESAPSKSLVDSSMFCLRDEGNANRAAKLFSQIVKACQKSK